MSEQKYTIELTKEQLKQLGIEIPTNKIEEKTINSPFDRAEVGEDYYYINYEGQVELDEETHNPFDDGCFEIANYCTDKKLMQQRAYHKILDDLLFRFSMQNDGDKVDWNDKESCKYYITYNYENMIFSVEHRDFMKSKEIYFYTRIIAQRAIEKIVLPFMKDNPEFVW